MNNDSGIFICPKCANNGMNGHKGWISREEYDNNELITKYIFYNGLYNFKWVCCSGCCCCNDIGEACGNIISCGCYGKCNNNRNPIVYCFYPCYFIFYIIIFIWIDIIKCLCCSKKKYKKIKGINEKDDIDSSRIWEVQGFSEKYYHSKFQAICDKCKYKAENFKEFIPKKKIENNQIFIINNAKLNEPLERENINSNEIIAINFTSGVINFCTTCKKSDMFYMIEQKLYLEYPEFKNKSIYFLANGIVLNKNKTIGENKINNGCNILINENI